MRLSTAGRDAVIGALFRGQSAAEIVKAVPPGLGCWTVTAGQFGFADWIEAWVQRARATEQVDTLDVWGWASEAGVVAQMARWGDTLDRFRLVLDGFYPDRYARDWELLLEALGSERIRTVVMHAKLAVLQPCGIVLSTSAGLGQNRRIEWFQAERSAARADMLEGVTDRIWRDVPPGNWMSRSDRQQAGWRAIGAKVNAEAPPEDMPIHAVQPAQEREIEIAAPELDARRADQLEADVEMAPIPPELLDVFAVVRVEHPQARRARAEARLREQQAAVERGELIERATVSRAWSELLAEFTKRLQGLGATLAPLVMRAAADGPEEIERVLGRELAALLQFWARESDVTSDPAAKAPKTAAVDAA